MFKWTCWTLLNTCWNSLETPSPIKLFNVKLCTVNFTTNFTSSTTLSRTIRSTLKFYKIIASWVLIVHHHPIFYFYIFSNPGLSYWLKYRLKIGNDRKSSFDCSKSNLDSQCCASPTNYPVPCQRDCRWTWFSMHQSNHAWCSKSDCSLLRQSTFSEFVWWRQHVQE